MAGQPRRRERPRPDRCRIARLGRPSGLGSRHAEARPYAGGCRTVARPHRRIHRDQNGLAHQVAHLGLEPRSATPFGRSERPVASKLCQPRPSQQYPSKHEDSRYRRFRLPGRQTHPALARRGPRGRRFRSESGQPCRGTLVAERTGRSWRPDRPGERRTGDAGHRSALLPRAFDGRRPRLRASRP